MIFVLNTPRTFLDFFLDIVFIFHKLKTVLILTVKSLDTFDQSK